MIIAPISRIVSLGKHADDFSIILFYSWISPRNNYWYNDIFIIMVDVKYRFYTLPFHNEARAFYSVIHYYLKEKTNEQQNMYRACVLIVFFSVAILIPWANKVILLGWRIHYFSRTCCILVWLSVALSLHRLRGILRCGSEMLLFSFIDRGWQRFWGWYGWVHLGGVHSGRRESIRTISNILGVISC